MTKSHGAPAAGGYHHKPVMLTEVLEVFEVIETFVNGPSTADHWVDVIERTVI